VLHAGSHAEDAVLVRLALPFIRWFLEMKKTGSLPPVFFLSGNPAFYGT
jgi:hypothetical protein